MRGLALLLLPLCSGAYLRPTARPTRAPPVVAKATAVPAESPAEDIARSLVTDDASASLSEPEYWRWIEGCGRPAESFDAVIDAIRESIATRDDVEVHVGCDSAVQGGDRVVFATVVCVISRGHAGRYFYSRLVEKKLHYPVLQTRLLREVELSLATAELLTANDVDVRTVHCDSNTDPRCKSTEHTRMLIGYIQSMGYEYLVKPDAWATFVADRHSRGLMRLRGRRAEKKLAWS